MKKRIPHTRLSIKVDSFDEVFDSWDPGADSIRRLDSEWLEYVLERMEHHPGKGVVDLVLQADSAKLTESSIDLITKGIRKGLAKKEELLTKRLRTTFALGRKSLGLGLAVLACFMAFSFLSEKLPLGGFQEFFREGFLIIGWVALWQPVETLLYDWWPIVAERRSIRRLRKGNVTLVTVEE